MGRPNPYFHGVVDSESKPFPEQVFPAVSGSISGKINPKVRKVVVRMQHLSRTFLEKARTPKKAAHAGLFCFSIVTARITVQAR
jgi:hypothetical protein